MARGLLDQTHRLVGVRTPVLLPVAFLLRPQLASIPRRSCHEQ